MRAISVLTIAVLIAQGTAHSQDWDGQQSLRKHACKTTMTFMPVHGTQVEFKTPDGRNFLWYPGNAGVLPGLWKLETRPSARSPGDWVHICFYYFTYGINPAIKRPGNEWACVSERLTKRWIVDEAEGDIFDLAVRGPVPFSLPREKTTLTDLLRAVREADAKNPPLQPPKVGDCGKTS